MSPMGRQPVSSSVSRAAACSGLSPGSRRPAGISHPHESVMNRWRQRSRTPRSARCTTAPAAGRGSRTTWCSKRSPPGTSTSTRRRLSQWLS